MANPIPARFCREPRGLRPNLPLRSRTRNPPLQRDALRPTLPSASSAFPRERRLTVTRIRGLAGSMSAAQLTHLPPWPGAICRVAGAGPQRMPRNPRLPTSGHSLRSCPSHPTSRVRVHRVGQRSATHQIRPGLPLRRVPRGSVTPNPCAKTLAQRQGLNDGFFSSPKRGEEFCKRPTPPRLRFGLVEASAAADPKIERWRCTRQLAAWLGQERSECPGTHGPRHRGMSLRPAPATPARPARLTNPGFCRVRYCGPSPAPAPVRR